LVLGLILFLFEGEMAVRGGSEGAAAASAKEVVDLKGRVVHPLNDSTARASVFIFVRPDCPISNRYAPEVRRLEEKFSGQGVVFWLVYTEADLSAAEIREHLQEYQYGSAALRDPGHRLVEFCHARVTPEAAIVGADGHLIYHGRIDDRYVALGQYRPTATRRELDEAITAVLRGGTVPSGHPAVGCAIAPAK
jgi:hypothetical protein